MKKARIINGFFDDSRKSVSYVRYGGGGRGYGGGRGSYDGELSFDLNDQSFGQEEEQKIVPKRYIVVPPDTKNGSKEWGVFDNLKREIVETYNNEFMVKEKVKYLNQKDARSYGFKKDLVRFAFIGAASLTPFIIKSLWDMWTSSKEADREETKDKKRLEMELASKKEEIKFKIEMEAEQRRKEVERREAERMNRMGGGK